MGAGGSMWVCGCLSLYICVCLCLSLCGCVWSCVSSSSFGVALCGCVHKLVCEPMLCGLAVEPWGCVAGVVIAYLHSKYFKCSLCWVHAQQCLFFTLAAAVCFFFNFSAATSEDDLQDLERLTMPGLLVDRVSWVSGIMSAMASWDVVRRYGRGEA